jgi:hypothetical protein
VSTVIAERALEFYGNDGVEAGAIRVYAPEFDGRFPTWRCRIEIAWPGYAHGRVWFGDDTWDVVFAGSAAALSVMAKTPDFIAGRIGVFGERLTSVEKLYKAFGVAPVEGSLQ